MALRVSTDSSQWLSPEADSADSTGSAPPPPAPATTTGPIGDVLEAYRGGEASSWPGEHEAFASSTASRREGSAQKNAAGGKKLGGSSFELESPISLDDNQGRQMLVASSPQLNEVSKKAGNGERVCAGAAMTNAMILASTSPEAREANAKALGKTAEDFGAYDRLPSSVKREDAEAALRAFANGQMRPHDVEVLQQLSYAMFVRAENGKDEGATPKDMAKVFAAMVGAGAQLGDTRFTMIGRHGNAHWLTTTNGTMANSYDGRGHASCPATAPAVPVLSEVALVNHDTGTVVNVKATGADDPETHKPMGTYDFNLSPASVRQNGKLDLANAEKVMGWGISLGAH